MNTNPFIHESVIVDASGVEWIARQTIGIGSSGMGESLRSDVEFVNKASGDTLHGHVQGITEVDSTELRAALDDALSRREAGYDW